MHCVGQSRQPHLLQMPMLMPTQRELVAARVRPPARYRGIVKLVGVAAATWRNTVVIDDE
jgi:hypothetical protein